MIFEPLLSLYDFSFYKKISSRSVGRSFLYLAYLGIIFSAAATLALKWRLAPTINETFQWLELSVPPLTFSNGKVTSPLDAPLTIRHPQLKEIAFIIDTARREPVTPQMMEESKVMGYLTANAFYLQQQSRELRVFDFSKGGPPRAVTLDSSFYRKANETLQRVLYPLALVFIFLFFTAWKSLSSLFYSLLALAINSIRNAGLAYGPLFAISVYAQTAMVFLQIIRLFLPFPIPFFLLLALGVTGAYIWLAVGKNRLATPTPKVP